MMIIKPGLYRTIASKESNKHHVLRIPKGIFIRVIKSDGVLTGIAYDIGGDCPVELVKEYPQIRLIKEHEDEFKF